MQSNSSPVTVTAVEIRPVDLLDTLTIHTRPLSHQSDQTLLGPLIQIEKWRTTALMTVDQI